MLEIVKAFYCEILIVNLGKVQKMGAQTLRKNFPVMCFELFCNVHLHKVGTFEHRFGRSERML